VDALEPKDIDPHALTRFAKEQALRLGFSLAGVTTPDPPPHVDVYRDWLSQGRHGEMAYLARPDAVERREDPRRILPECRSILVLAWPYAPPSPPATRGRIAAYARGPDYHDVLLDRIAQWVLAMQARLGRSFSFRAYTDTGPLLERELAQRAGLGWIGKNTCLIHPRRGSYMLLAEVLLGLALAPDPPFGADRCGSCTRCLDACPTDCILPDRTLDARRCISYLTIELRGPIPVGLRESIGDWLFGCDVCQQVCPWNIRFAEGAAIPSASVELDMADTLALDDGEIRRRTRGTALRRTRRAGLVRNAALVAANTGAQDLRPALERRLTGDPDPTVRQHAAWALGRLGGPDSQRVLQESLESEADPAVRDEIRQAMK
jgi:epoxyqueuosine reductase